MKILITVLLTFIGLLLAYILLICISSFLVDTKKEYSTNSRYYRWLLNSATGLLLFFGRIKVKVSGEEKIPSDSRFLFVSNHRSKFDPIISWYILRKYDVAFISKPENFDVPAFGRIIRKCCFMAIDRENPRNAIKTIIKASELIKSDTVSIGVYPEGTRSKTNELLPFHNGVFKIAQKANVPIVVASIRGTEKIHKNTPFRSVPVNIDILDVLSPEDIYHRRTDQIGEIIRNEIEKKLIA